MTGQRVIEEFLNQRVLAFVGLSRDRTQFANVVYRHMKRGRRMHPVHRDPHVTILEGDRVVHSMSELPPEVEGLVVMVPPNQTEAVVRDAIAHGVPRVWLHRGIGTGSATPEAVKACTDAGVPVVAGACPLMFDGKPTGPHRVHAFFSAGRAAKRVGAA